MKAPNNKLIHVAEIHRHKEKKCYLFLRQLDLYRYVWFLALTQEIETPIWGATSEEAIAAAHKNWKQDFFRPLSCGFRYTLPERDEVGNHALFYQMIASYSSPNGVYFEEELGSNCIVQNASLEARNLWKYLQQTNQL
jgi:hypothetical protein